MCGDLETPTEISADTLTREGLHAVLKKRPGDAWAEASKRQMLVRPLVNSIPHGGLSCASRVGSAVLQPLPAVRADPSRVFVGVAVSWPQGQVAFHAEADGVDCGRAGEGGWRFQCRSSCVAGLMPPGVLLRREMFVC